MVFHVCWDTQRKNFQPLFDRRYDAIYIFHKAVAKNGPKRILPMPLSDLSLTWGWREQQGRGRSEGASLPGLGRSGVALLYKEQELRKRRKEKTRRWKKRRAFLLGTWLEQEKIWGEPFEEKDDCRKGLRETLIWGLQQANMDLEDHWVVVLISFHG